jgi:hypothetical protein
MIKDFRLKQYEYLSDILPFFSALFIVSMPSSRYVVAAVLERFLISGFLFTSWQALRNLYFHIKSKPKANWADYFSLLFLALVTPVFLQVLKNKLETEGFYLVCILILSSLLIQIYEKRIRPVFSVITKIIHIFFAVLTGFVFFEIPVSKGTILFSLSITLIFSAQYLSLLAYRGQFKFYALDEKFPKRIWSVLFSLFLVLGPVTVLGMVILGLLSRFYCFVLLVLPLAGQVISRINLKHSPDIVTKAIFAETSGISLLFIVIIMIIKLSF